MMWSTKTDRNNFRIIFSKPVNEEISNFILFLLTAQSFLVLIGSCCSDLNMFALIPPAEFLLKHSILLFMYKSKMSSILA